MYNGLLVNEYTWHGENETQNPSAANQRSGPAPCKNTQQNRFLLHEIRILGSGQHSQLLEKFIGCVMASYLSMLSATSTYVDEYVTTTWNSRVKHVQYHNKQCALIRVCFCVTLIIYGERMFFDHVYEQCCFIFVSFPRFPSCKKYFIRLGTYLI